MWLPSTHSGSRQALAYCRQDAAPKSILNLTQGRSQGTLKLPQGCFLFQLSEKFKKHDRNVTLSGTPSTANLSYPCPFFVDLLCLLTMLVSPAKRFRQATKCLLLGSFERQQVSACPACNDAQPVQGAATTALLTSIPEGGWGKHL